MSSTWLRVTPPYRTSHDCLLSLKPSFAPLPGVGEQTATLSTTLSTPGSENGKLAMLELCGRKQLHLNQG